MKCPSCGKKTLLDFIVCPACGWAWEPAAVPAPEQEPSPFSAGLESAPPEGIGGWLVLPLLGLIVTPLWVGFSLVSGFAPLLADGRWMNLVVPGRPAYHPMWGVVLLNELMGNTAIIAAAVVLLVMFLRRSRRLPLAMVAYYAAAFLFVASDAFLMRTIPAVAKQDPSGTVAGVLRTALVAAIWIPYFLRSERVKRTFTVGREPGAVPG